ncbi:HpcH/HpaI aldolase/citrate lyase family protein [Labrys monachus]|uniref:Citrate lyase subunit beta/citryl-CoA lyase n=1 Tax=Labrys monachus TaxID=217067 RepID=A0ABU0F9M2_9HYPH|nr:CoA ester lyase [Labrys monachus]MDQ0391309.1 citrate lyase subunit beta/citryl-CoA lyase [Labrys monachus]
MTRASEGHAFVAPLFVPANRRERFVKAAASGADAVFIDLEDAVPAGDKTAAREGLEAGFTDMPVYVRVNADGTVWHDADIEAIAALPLAGLVLPKAEAGPALRRVAGRQAVIALIETARGLATAREIAATPGVVRLAFGSIDFCADVGCQHTRQALLAARSEIVLASRLAGLPAPLDGVTTSLTDIALVEDDARHARELGFGGKLCIHPVQIAGVFSGFSPTAAEIEWARKMLDNADGASVVDGAMVDAPVRARARAILGILDRSPRKPIDSSADEAR